MFFDYDIYDLLSKKTITVWKSQEYHQNKIKELKW